jgi:hypothetical protein
MNLKDPEGVMYLNCENNKKLPFRAKFKQFTITDPMQVFEAFKAAELKPEIHTIVVDTLTFLMDMYETLYVLPHAGTPKGMTAWGEYAQFMKKLMSQYVAMSTKNVIFLAHTSDVISDENVTETIVKVKGSLMNQGVESFFSTVVSTKKVLLKDLKDECDLLVITEQEKALGFKHVFQTEPTKRTINERMRSSFAMWEPTETYINNDCQSVIDRLHEYYA